MAAYTPDLLDESLYKADDAEFIKEQTGIHDPDELKRHIIAVQTKAYSLFNYHCIHSFSFIRARISKYPVYEHVLSLGRERDGAILLDLGCCLGTDLRKAASDGFPAQNLIGSDLRLEFWTLGHELFSSTPATCPIAFVAGDALDPDFLEPVAPAASPPAVPAPPLASLTRLTPLRGHVAAIHVSSVFHFFLEPQQLQLARALAGLLSPFPGSVIFGSHVGLRTKGTRGEVLSRHEYDRMFCHSPESWVAMWKEVFPERAVKVDTQLVRYVPNIKTPLAIGMELLEWSVTRL
ncbi:hypothetical protein B0H17DRAFT_1037756 [Mycena rosella]|uniref:Methyltransferase domain-containing protein n=1 Tax=Mycena rosella TaxID=1033263 RepID=A0AAD7M8D0_MYCRO|nr:hypothetical protein B0H17DRAFT_1037756 [Mycena rosella]